MGAQYPDQQGPPRAEADVGQTQDCAHDQHRHHGERIAPTVGQRQAVECGPQQPARGGGDVDPGFVRCRAQRQPGQPQGHTRGGGQHLSEGSVEQGGDEQRQAARGPGASFVGRPSQHQAAQRRDDNECVVGQRAQHSRVSRAAVSAHSGHGFEGGVERRQREQPQAQPVHAGPAPPGLHAPLQSSVLCRRSNLEIQRGTEHHAGKDPQQREHAPTEDDKKAGLWTQAKQQRRACDAQQHHGDTQPDRPVQSGAQVVLRFLCQPKAPQRDRTQAVAQALERRPDHGRPPDRPPALALRLQLQKCQQRFCMASQLRACGRRRYAVSQRCMQSVGRARAQGLLLAEIVQPTEMCIQCANERVGQLRQLEHPVRKLGGQHRLLRQGLLVQGLQRGRPRCQQCGLAAATPSQLQ